MTLNEIYDGVRAAPALRSLRDQPFVPGAGPDLGAKGIVIGEAPGANEAKKGEPFVGASGKFLNRAMKNVDLDRSELWVTNVVKFRPPSNRTPTESEIAASLPFLYEEMRLVARHNSPVLLCGTVAKVVAGASLTITSLRGQIIERYGFRFIITWHPSYCMRQGGLSSKPGGQFQDDVRLFKLAVDGAI